MPLAVSVEQVLAVAMMSAINRITGILNKIPGVNIGRVNWGNVHIPRLAQGAVIPANREFLAVLGDQKRGTNIEAPADLIRQIVREEVGQASGSTHVTIVLDSVDGTYNYQFNSERGR